MQHGRPHDLDDASDDAWPGARLGPVGDFGAAAVIRTTLAAPPSRQALFLTEAGDATAISVNDLHQGQIGDCFLITAIGELAINRPAAISGMIHANANGTETVTLYEDRGGRPPTPWTTEFKPVSVTVGNVFPTYSVNNGAAQGVVSGQKEIWAQVLEKAVATLDGGYSAIAGGGNPTVAMEELTGHPATFLSAASVTLAQLQTWMRAGDLIAFDTSAASGAYNLVGGHAYMFEGLTTVGGAPAVKLGNPWGFDQPSAVPLSQIGRAFAEVDVGRVA